MINNVGIIGLGLIGGSMAKTISSNTSHSVYAYNRTHKVLEEAIEEGAVCGELNENTAADIDLLIIALYPKDVENVLNQYLPYMKKGTIIVDCTGVKGSVCRELSGPLAKQGFRFVGGHPMAGKEVAGYKNADSTLYNRASMILCRDEYTDEEAFLEVKDFFKEIGFPIVTESNPLEHDQVIAFTSQLAHVISNAYVKSPTLNKRKGFSAGSFKDLSRVAKLNEYMWTDLFLANKDALLEEIDTFIHSVSEYRDALAQEDKNRLIELLGDGRKLKELDEENNND